MSVFQIYLISFQELFNISLYLYHIYHDLLNQSSPEGTLGLSTLSLLKIKHI